MTFPHVLSIASAVCGSIVISLGMVLQKKGVGWIGWKGPKDRHYRKLKTIWFTGFGLNNLLSIFYFFALKGLSSAVVGSMMGLNIAFSATFSALILKEPLSKRIVTGSMAMVCFIVLANLGAPANAPSAIPNFWHIASFFVAPYVLIGSALAIRRLFRIGGDLYAMAFAAAAGSLEGFIIVLIKTMQVNHGDDLLRYFTTPYLYMYIVASISLIGFMQVAYAHGRMTKTGPVLWGMQIFYPVAITYTSFAAPLVPAQLAAFSGILACVVLIQSKR